MINLCECGCGNQTLLATKTNIKKGRLKGRHLRFIHGHNAKSKEQRDFLRQLRKKEGTIPPSRKGISLSVEHRKRISKTTKGRIGRPLSDETRKKISQKLLGHKYPKTRNDKIAEWVKNNRRGNKNPGWRGGITEHRLLIRNSFKYKEWRQKVFIRDSFKCIKCGSNHSKDLNAHHKKSFKRLLEEAKRYLPLFSLYDAAMIYEPLWDVANGLTLCELCHKKIK
jgi:hypothetical protein